MATARIQRRSPDEYVGITMIHQGHNAVPPRTGDQPAATAPDRPFALFATAFALALVAHQLWWRGVPGPDLHGIVVVLAIWVVARPAAAVRLAALAAAEVVAVAHDLPAVGDHTLLAAVTALGFVTAFVVATARGRALPAPDALWQRLAPFVRLQAILLYAAAALAKLNSGFLDAATSCAGPLAAQLAFFDDTLLDGRWHIVPAIVATIVVEALLAVLLTVPRTRVAGVVLGASFHSALALAGNVPFAAYALALYVAFLPAAMLPVCPAPSARRLALGAATLWLAGSAADPAAVRDLLQIVLRIVVAAGLLGFAVAVARRACRQPHGPVAPGRARALGPVYACAVVLLAANAVSPYVGLKTEASFAMFSNLQTEPGHWNHLLVPEAVRVFDAQDQLVRLESTTAPTLERRRRAGILMVRAELERYLREHPGERAVYVDARDASRRFTASGTTLPARPVLDRIMNFYDVRPSARGRC